MQNSTETLHTCPTCNTPGFTERGLKAHRCKGINRTLSAAPGGSESKSDMILAPGKSPKAPRLAKGNDTEVAQELGRLVRDAQDGTRRILICGLFIETIVANLKHGQLGPWLDAHETEIGCSRRSIFAWRELSSEVMKQVGVEKVQLLHFSKPLHETLALPVSEVPEDAREVREKIDELIAGKSVRQLMFQFREGEVFEDKLIRTGRGGDRTANRGPRRTNDEIERETFELAGKAACNDARRVLRHLLTLTGPVKLGPGGKEPPRAWDLLDDKALRELKEMAIDLRDGILASESRRAQLRPRTK
jgi:hypothetical protein